MTSIGRATGTGSLSIDIWGHHQVWASMISDLAISRPDLPIAVSMRRNLPAALQALADGGLDAAFGRVPGLEGPPDPGLRHRPIRLETTSIVVSARHRLADAVTVTPADLRPEGIWFPQTLSSPELGTWARDFSAWSGVGITVSGVNLGMDHAAAELAADPAKTLLLPSQMARGGGPLRAIPIVDPSPCWAWSVAWRRDDANPMLAQFLGILNGIARREKWLDFDPRLHWLPEIDLAGLAGLTRPTRPTGSQPSGDTTQSATPAKERR
ncbi:LysR substrate-binding domain-containing protein [Catenulispora yoronensis]